MDKKVPAASEIVDKSEDNAVELVQAIAVAGIGVYNLKYCLVLALFLTASIIEPVGYSFVLPSAKCDLHMTDAHRGFIASVPYIGIVVSAYPWGYLVDIVGRKRITLYSSMACGAFAVLSAFMPELISFTVCKFITALSLVGPAAVPYTYIGEIIPEKDRDITMTVTNSIQILGAVLVPLLAWAVLPLDFRIPFGLYEFRPWRLLTILYGSILLLSALLLSFGPESPMFLVSQGKHDEALKTLQIIYAGNKGKSTDDYPVKKIKMPDQAKEKQSFLVSLKSQSIPLLKPPYVKWLFLNGFLLFGVYSILNGICAWVPDILNRVITGKSEVSTACEVIKHRLKEAAAKPTECVDTLDTKIFLINTLSQICCAIVGITVSGSVKFISKKALLVVVYFTIGGFNILINFITHNLVFATLLSAFPIMCLAIGPVNSYSVDIFPTHLRGMAMSLTMMMGRMGSVAGANVAGALINAACEATFYVFGGLLLLCGSLVFLLPKSSKAKPPQPLQQMHTPPLSTREDLSPQMPQAAK